MSHRLVVALATASLALSMNPAVVSAHASLVRCTINNNQSFVFHHAPSVVRAFFAEELVPGTSWIAIYENQADHGLVTEKRHSSVNFRNPKEIDLRLPPLNRGKYSIIWYTQSSVDQHFAAGVVYFRVK